MKRRHVLTTLALTFVIAGGCESNPVAPDADGTDDLTATGEAGQFFRRRRSRPAPAPVPPPPPPPAPAPAPAPAHNVDYQLSERDAFDPLWRFSRMGDQVLLQTDPSVTHWGTDYWGYWKNPYPVDGHVVAYTVGLTHTTYELRPRSDGSIDVTKTLVVHPYQGGAPTTTVTHVGIFRRIE